MEKSMASSQAGRAGLLRIHQVDAVGTISLLRLCRLGRLRAEDRCCWLYFTVRVWYKKEDATQTLVILSNM